MLIFASLLITIWKTLIGSTTRAECRDPHEDIFDPLLPALMDVAHLMAQCGEPDAGGEKQYRDVAEECCRIQKDLMVLRTELLIDTCKTSVVLPTTQHLRDPIRSFSKSPKNASFWAWLLLAEILIARSVVKFPNPKCSFRRSEVVGLKLVPGCKDRRRCLKTSHSSSRGRAHISRTRRSFERLHDTILSCCSTIREYRVQS
jgi:hypothetical protein